MISPWIWDISEIISKITPDFGTENGWMLYVFATLIFGIIIGGMMRGLAKLVLGIVMLMGFAVLVLLLMQKQDLLSMIASVVFGIIILLFSLLVKIGKSYPYIKR